MAHADQALPLNAHSPFQLGGALIDPPRLRVERGDTSQRVEAKVMQTLLALAQEHGRVVSRQDLEREVWPGQVVTDDAVTNAIGKLRRALQDKRRKPRVIETIAKSGYRLKLSPEPLVLQPAASPALPAGAGWRRRPRLRRALGAGLAVVALVAVAVSAWKVWQPAPTPGQAPKAALSIAVIPFDVLGDDRSQSYFAEGLTLDLITELSRFPQLLVIAPGSVFGYRDAAADDRSIADELGVRYLIRGGVQRRGGRMRINVRLLEAESGRTLWADRFAGEPSGLFRIQDQVVRGIVAALPRQLALPDRPFTRSGATDSIAAYDEPLRGIARYGRRTPEDNAVARGHLEQAIALDPNYADAFALLAWVLHYAGRPDRAEPALAEARRRNPESAASYDQIAGEIRFATGRYEAAEASFRAALERNPAHMRARLWLTATLVQLGREDEAVWEV